MARRVPPRAPIGPPPPRCGRGDPRVRGASPGPVPRDRPRLVGRHLPVRLGRTGTARGHQPVPVRAGCPRARPRCGISRASGGIFEGINNKDIPTIYPPLMQIAFFAVTTVSESVLAMKLFFVMADIGVVFALFRLLGALRLEANRALVYAWSPLPIVEVAGSGHNDALAVLLFVAALVAIVQHRDRLTMALLSLSGLSKLVGALMTPLFLRECRPRSYWVFPGLLVLVSLPYAAAGSLAFVRLDAVRTAVARQRQHLSRPLLWNRLPRRRQGNRRRAPRGPRPGASGARRPPGARLVPRAGSAPPDDDDGASVVSAVDRSPARGVPEPRVALPLVGHRARIPFGVPLGAGRARGSTWFG